MTALTSAETQMLQTIRTRADELARLVSEANAAGFTISFNINGATGSCDVFDVFRMVKIDMRSGAN